MPVSLIAEHLLPFVNDVALYPARNLRRQLLQDAQGVGVEIGFGSGVNAEFYSDRVRRLYAVEPSEPMWRRGAKRAAAAGLAVERLDLFAESLPLDDASVDFAVSTFVLCSVRDVDAVLAELARVLRPGGSLYVLEHTQNPARRIARCQKLVTPVWRTCLAGCHPGRPLETALAASSLEAALVDHATFPWLPTVVEHHVIGRWEKPSASAPTDA